MHYIHIIRVCRENSHDFFVPDSRLDFWKIFEKFENFFYIAILLFDLSIHLSFVSLVEGALGFKDTVLFLKHLLWVITWKGSDIRTWKGSDIRTWKGLFWWIGYFPVNQRSFKGGWGLGLVWTGGNESLILSILVAIIDFETKVLSRLTRFNWTSSWLDWIVSIPTTFIINCWACR